MTRRDEEILWQRIQDPFPHAQNADTKKAQEHIRHLRKIGRLRPNELPPDYKTQEQIFREGWRAFRDFLALPPPGCP